MLILCHTFAARYVRHRWYRSFAYRKSLSEKKGVMQMQRKPEMQCLLLFMFMCNNSINRGSGKNFHAHAEERCRGFKIGMKGTINEEILQT